MLLLIFFLSLDHFRGYHSLSQETIYTVILGDYTRNEAEEICITRGMYIATIDTQDDYQRISESLDWSQYNLSDVWINSHPLYGAHMSDDDGDEDIGEMCLIFKHNSSRPLLQDADCCGQHTTVCQRIKDKNTFKQEEYQHGRYEVMEAKQNPQSCWAECKNRADCHAYRVYTWRTSSSWYWSNWEKMCILYTKCTSSCLRNVSCYDGTVEYLKDEEDLEEIYFNIEPDSDQCVPDQGDCSRHVSNLCIKYRDSSQPLTLGVFLIKEGDAVSVRYITDNHEITIDNECYTMSSTNVYISQYAEYVIETSSMNSSKVVSEGQVSSKLEPHLSQSQLINDIDSIIESSLPQSILMSVSTDLHAGDWNSPSISHQYELTIDLINDIITAQTIVATGHMTKYTLPESTDVYTSEFIETIDVSEIEHIISTDEHWVDPTETVDVSVIEPIETIDVSEIELTLYTDVYEMASTETFVVSEIESTATTDVSEIELILSTDVYGIESSETSDVSEIKPTDVHVDESTPTTDVSEMLRSPSTREIEASSTTGHPVIEPSVSIDVSGTTYLSVTPLQEPSHSSVFGADSTESLCPFRTQDSTRNCGCQMIVAAQSTDELRLERTSLSAYRRSKTSAYDARISAVYVGSSGILIFIVVFLLVLCMDLDRLRDVKPRRRRWWNFG